MNKGEEGRDWIKISDNSRPGFSIPSGSELIDSVLKQ